MTIKANETNLGIVRAALDDAAQPNVTAIQKERVVRAFWNLTVEIPDPIMPVIMDRVELLEAQIKHLVAIGKV